jgi:hypothetical protein
MTCARDLSLASIGNTCRTSAVENGAMVLTWKLKAWRHRAVAPRTITALTVTDSERKKDSRIMERSLNMNAINGGQEFHGCSEKAEARPTRYGRAFSGSASALGLAAQAHGMPVVGVKAS